MDSDREGSGVGTQRVPLKHRHVRLFLLGATSLWRGPRAASYRETRGPEEKLRVAGFATVFTFRSDRLSSVHVYLDPDYTDEDAARFTWGMNRKW